MKKLIVITAIIIGLFSGCTTDRFYQAGKVVYIAGKKVVIENWDALPKDVQDKLIKLDKAARTYDKARKIVKPAIEKVVEDVKSESTISQKPQSN